VIQLRNIALIMLVLLALNAVAQEDQNVSPDTVIDFSVSTHRGIKGDGSVAYVLENDDQTITAYRHRNVLWKVNIINQCGVPAIGESKVRYLRLEADHLKVIYGKHNNASINIYTGELLCEGADKKIR